LTGRRRLPAYLGHHRRPNSCSSLTSPSRFTHSSLHLVSVTLHSLTCRLPPSFSIKGHPQLPIPLQNKPNLGIIINLIQFYSIQPMHQCIGVFYSQQISIISLLIPFLRVFGVIIVLQLDLRLDLRDLSAIIKAFTKCVQEQTRRFCPQCDRIQTTPSGLQDSMCYFDHHHSMQPSSHGSHKPTRHSIKDTSHHQPFLMWLPTPGSIIVSCKSGQRKSCYPSATPATPCKGRGMSGVTTYVPLPLPPPTLQQYPQGFAYPCHSLWAVGMNSYETVITQLTHRGARSGPMSKEAQFSLLIAVATQCGACSLFL
jgi:hypothetical protein